MPEVGDKKFDYTEEGKAAAKAYAEKTGKKISKKKPKPDKDKGKESYQVIKNTYKVGK
tara:strand:- start:1880 stop:2053 length:174 start_codon:yes stop_codon:yes gene_type:complete